MEKQRTVEGRNHRSEWTGKGNLEVDSWDSKQGVESNSLGPGPLQVTQDCYLCPWLSPSLPPPHPPPTTTPPPPPHPSSVFHLCPWSSLPHPLSLFLHYSYLCHLTPVSPCSIFISVHDLESKYPGHENKVLSSLSSAGSVVDSDNRDCRFYSHFYQFRNLYSPFKCCSL